MKVSHAGAELRRESRDALLTGQLLVAELVSESPALRTHGIVLNLSKGGMAVQTFRPLAHGQIAEIQLSLPKFSSSAGRGLVRWQKQGGVAGIRFLPPLNTLPQLRQWVQRYRSPSASNSAPPLSANRTSPVQANLTRPCTYSPAVPWPSPVRPGQLLPSETAAPWNVAQVLEALRPWEHSFTPILESPAAAWARAQWSSVTIFGRTRGPTRLPPSK